jgi:hypothetical protein
MCRGDAPEKKKKRNDYQICWLYMFTLICLIDIFIGMLHHHHYYIYIESTLNRSDYFEVLKTNDKADKRKT